MRASVLLIDRTCQYVIIINRQKSGRTYNVIPGGGIESGEDFKQAAIREMKEELSIDISSYKFSSPLPHDDGVCFLVKTDLEVEPLVISGEELERSSSENIYTPRWVTLTSLPQLVLYPIIDFQDIERKLHDC